ncbi:MAG: hypothetical protein ACM3VV_03720 [Deltaproteobacteria bacterium]|nr:hypothetical protein [Nitrososphaeraceae archaeon]
MIVPSTAIFFIITIFSTLTFTASTFEQSDGKNHTMQNMEESANQTIQNMSQSTNKTGEAIPIQKNITDLGSNLTEVAKKLAKSIDEGIKNLSQ